MMCNKIINILAGTSKITPTSRENIINNNNSLFTRFLSCSTKCPEVFISARVTEHYPRLHSAVETKCLADNSSLYLRIQQWTFFFIWAAQSLSFFLTKEIHCSFWYLFFPNGDGFATYILQAFFQHRRPVLRSFTSVKVAAPQLEIVFYFQDQWTLLTYKHAYYKNNVNKHPNNQLLCGSGTRRKVKYRWLLKHSTKPALHPAGPIM